MFQGTIQSDDPTDENNNTPILAVGSDAEDARYVAEMAFSRYRVILDDEPVKTVLPPALSEDYPHEQVPADINVSRNAYARITQTWDDISASLP